MPAVKLARVCLATCVRRAAVGRENTNDFPPMRGTSLLQALLRYHPTPFTPWWSQEERPVYHS